MTPAELRTEIESGPLAAELAPLVSVGNDTGVLAMLRDPTKRTRRVPRTLDLTDLAGMEGFAPQSVAAVFQHPRFSDFREVVNNQNGAGAVAIAGLFAATGVIQPGDLAAFATYANASVERPCSRLDELGWSPSVEEIGLALLPTRS